MPPKSRRNEQIVHVLGQVDAGEEVAEVCGRLVSVSRRFCPWKEKFAGLSVQGLHELGSLRDENRKLKQLVADGAPEAR